MGIRLVRREDASEMVLMVMVSAITALMSLRIYLELTDYPRIGRGIWHISHALTGGLVMAAGQLVNLIWHGDRARKISAVIFGIGFGWFIDELGKYITTDYDYLFKPAFSFIYIVFVLLFLLYWWLEREFPKDPRTLTYQVLNQLEDIADNNLTKPEKDKALTNLKLISSKGTEESRLLARRLHRIVEETEAKEEGKNRLKTWWKKMGRLWYAAFKKRLFQFLLIVVAVVFTTGSLIDSVRLLSRFGNREIFDYWTEGKELLTRADINMFTFKTVADGAASTLYLAGLFWIFRRNKILGINYFQYGLTVNIFLSSVFKFYFEQLGAVAGVLSSALILVGLSQLKKDGSIEV